MVSVSVRAAPASAEPSSVTGHYVRPEPEEWAPNSRTLCSAKDDEAPQAVRPYALYLRIRPWLNRDFDIQVGRVPPTFGAFARRTYANDNPLIGYPLAYST